MEGDVDGDGQDFADAHNVFGFAQELCKKSN